MIILIGLLTFILGLIGGAYLLYKWLLAGVDWAMAFFLGAYMAKHGETHTREACDKTINLLKGMQEAYDY